MSQQRWSCHRLEAVSRADKPPLASTVAPCLRPMGEHCVRESLAALPFVTISIVESLLHCDVEHPIALKPNRRIACPIAGLQCVQDATATAVESHQLRTSGLLVVLSVEPPLLLQSQVRLKLG